MNIFTRLLLPLLLVGSGITGGVDTLFAAQQPSQPPKKHKQDAEEVEKQPAKKPKKEVSEQKKEAPEQKDDSGREEKMDVEEYRRIEAAQSSHAISSKSVAPKDSAADQDDSTEEDDSEEDQDDAENDGDDDDREGDDDDPEDDENFDGDDDKRFSTPEVDAVADEIRDLVIARYCAAPHTYNPDVVVASLTSDVEKILNERHIPYASDDLCSFHDMIDATLEDDVRPHFADFWQLSLLRNNQLSSYATPGEIATALEESHQTAGNFDEEQLRQNIQRHRDLIQGVVREACTTTILDALKEMNLTNDHCSVLSHISLWYKNLFGVDADGNRQRDEHGQLIINRDAVAHLVGHDTDLIQNFVTLYGEKIQREALVSEAFSKAQNVQLSQKYRKLQCAFGDLKYRLHKFTESLVLKFDSGHPSPVRNYYFDIIANYASQNQRDNAKACDKLLALRAALGLERVSQEPYTRVFECYIIGALCSQVMQNFNAAFFDNTPKDLIQNFVRQTMEFEILYGGTADESLIQDLHQKKETILSMVKNVKTNTFRAYSKSLHSIGTLQQIQVTRDHIDTSEALFRNRGNDADVCSTFDAMHEAFFVNPVTITNFEHPDGFDHSGINRTMNTLLAQSFLGNVFFSPEGGYVVPNPLNGIRPPEGFESIPQSFVSRVATGTFRALGMWLSIVFLNDIAVPLPLPTAFYAAIENRLPKADSVSMLMWAEYLKELVPETFRSYRDLFHKLLYGTLDELKEYCRDILGWTAAEYAEISEQNKCHKILEAVILPKFNLVDASSYESIGHRFFGGFQDLEFTDHRLFNVAFNGMKLESPVTEEFLRNCFYSDYMKVAKKFLRTFFQWLSPYDLAHFFPTIINADVLLAHLVFDRNKLGGNPALLQVADTFEQAVREYIQENRENQERLQNFVGYFAGSPIYYGNNLTVHFSVNEPYDYQSATCFAAVYVNLTALDAIAGADHGQASQQAGDVALKAKIKQEIAKWHGSEHFSYE
ncbi:MAG: cell envelope integrity protein TolA [Candidatus Babeliales bacterium]